MLGTLLLLTTPGQWRALLENPALIPDAVEELLRAAPFGDSVGGIPRYARADLKIDGVAIQAGDLMLLDIGSANHDPSIFSDPDRADITRKHAAHLTFGHGAHYCIGAPLARIELKTVFAQMIPRFPSMHLAVDAATLTTRDVICSPVGSSNFPCRGEPRSRIAIAAQHDACRPNWFSISGPR